MFCHIFYLPLMEAIVGFVSFRSPPSLQPYKMRNISNTYVCDDIINLIDLYVTSAIKIFHTHTDAITICDYAADGAAAAAIINALPLISVHKY